jgi:hypothetical protein
MAGVRITHNKNGNLSESSIQKMVVQWADSHHFLRNLVIHIPNEGKRSYSTAYTLKAMGMRSGIPDLFVAYPSNGYHGAWIELKSEKGKVSKAQSEFIELLRSQNYFVCVCFSFEEAVETIGKYCNLFQHNP